MTSLPVRTTANTAAEHVSDHNVIHPFLNLETNDNDIRYVSRNGNDSNDGTSWGSAKLTVASAIASLPLNSSTRHGKVIVGRGTFVETSTPIQLRGGLIIEGTGTATPGDVPTTIRLGNGRNTHLFECPTLTASNHGLALRDMVIDGNKANNTGLLDTLVLGAGFNVYLMNIYLRDAARWGVRMEGAPQNIQMFNITGSGCGSTSQGGFMYYTTLDGGTFSLDGFQIDQCGLYPFFWEHTSSAAGHKAVLRNGKVEMQDAVNTTLHTNVFRFKPRVSAGGNPPSFTLENIFINHNTGTTDQFAAAIYEESQSGVGARWFLKDVYASGVSGQYQKAFLSDKTTRSSVGKDVRTLFETDSATLRAIEMDGVTISAGTGAPSGADGLPIGSLYLNRSGGASTTLYVKTGASTWTAK
jgi:hypothetical protein